jgi:hypothetical protein
MNISIRGGQAQGEPECDKSDDSTRTCAASRRFTVGIRIDGYSGAVRADGSAGGSAVGPRTNGRRTGSFGSHSGNSGISALLYFLTINDDKSALSWPRSLGDG